MPEGDYQSPYDDEPSIVDGDFLYRCVHPSYIDWDRTLADGPAVSKQVFQDYSSVRALELGYPAPGMSVTLARLLEERGHTFRKLLDLFDDSWGIVELSVRAVRRLEPRVGITLAPTEAEPWHAMIFSMTQQRLNKRQQDLLRDTVTRWSYVPPRQ